MHIFVNKPGCCLVTLKPRASAVKRGMLVPATVRVFEDDEDTSLPVTTTQCKQGPVNIVNLIHLTHIDNST